MSNRERHHGQTLQRQAVSWSRRRPCNSSLPRRIPWKENSFQQGIPPWEREFCFKIGLFTRKKFTEVKSYVHLYENILQWNDSAAEEAFYAAKNRFKAEFHHLPCSISLPNPDKFIDEVDWDAEIDPELVSGLEVGTDDEEENKNGIYQSVANNIPYSEIKPTGWDVDVTEYSGPKVLTGLIVGDDM